jgi:type IV secretory pathway VirJ component
LLRRFWPFLAVVIFAVAIAVLHRELATYRFADIRHSLRTVSPGALARSLLVTALAYAVLPVVLIGCSRGADLVPFMASRLPPDLRDKVALTALIGPGQGSSFEFSLLDIARSHARPDTFPVQPEVAKLRGTPVVCLYGSKDRGAICRSLGNTGLARAVEPAGGHRVSADDGPALVATILDALPKPDGRPVA